MQIDLFQSNPTRTRRYRASNCCKSEVMKLDVLVFPGVLFCKGRYKAQITSKTLWLD